MLRVRRVVVSGAGVIALSFAAVAPSPALAAGVMPIDASQTEPVQSASIVAGQASLSFKVVAPTCSATEMFVEVASRETYDSNSSLADSVQTDYFALAQAEPRSLPGPDQRAVAEDTRRVFLAGLHARQLRRGVQLRTRVRQCDTGTRPHGSAPAAR